MPYKVVLDSNFLLLPINLRLDIFAEIEKLLPGRVQIILISPVRKELERLSHRSSEIGRRAAFALKLINRCKEVDTELSQFRTVDDALFNFAKRRKLIVATADMELKIRLRDINVPVIYVRGHSRLELEGFPVKER